MKKARKAKTDRYLALFEYRNTPSQRMDSSPVVRIMSRRTRTQVPTLPRLLGLVVDVNVHDKLLTNKERQASNYNKGVKDLAELKSGDTVRLIPLRSLTNEAVKARVEKPEGTRSYEVITEYGARYRQNRRHLGKPRVLQQKHVDALLKPGRTLQPTGNKSITVVVQALSWSS